MDVNKLEKKLNIEFKNKDLLRNAFVHRSYLNENRDFELESNERLEFLGDAVLQLLSSEFLYKNYEHQEGRLTNYRSSLVNTKRLAETSKDLDLGQFLYLSKGEEANDGRESEYILANTFEAFLGSLYLDQDLDTCRNFLKKVLFPKLEAVIKNKTYKDYKSKFQEKAQEEYSETPMYKVVKEWGPDHDKMFAVEVLVGGKAFAEGKGRSKQKAEQNAAKKALEKI